MESVNDALQAGVQWDNLGDLKSVARSQGYNKSNWKRATILNLITESMDKDCGAESEEALANTSDCSPSSSSVPGARSAEGTSTLDGGIEQAVSREPDASDPNELLELATTLWPLVEEGLYNSIVQQSFYQSELWELFLCGQPQPLEPAASSAQLVSIQRAHVLRCLQRCAGPSPLPILDSKQHWLLFWSREFEAARAHLMLLYRVELSKFGGVIEASLGQEPCVWVVEQARYATAVRPIL